jgi:Nucleotidyl transferase AbiEii toxin, Type IV TA system
LAEVDSPAFKLPSRWRRSAEFAPAELVATKLRALYQRSKGRDLFDLWLALTALKIPPSDILRGFAPYRPERYVGALAISNLEAKLNEPRFRDDLDNLVATWPPGYAIRDAADLIVEQLLR